MGFPGGLTTYAGFADRVGSTGKEHLLLMRQKTEFETPVKRQSFRQFDRLKTIVIFLALEGRGYGSIKTPTRHLWNNGIRPKDIVRDVVVAYGLKYFEHNGEVFLEALSQEDAVAAAVHLHLAAIIKSDNSHLAFFHAAGGNA